MDIKHIWNTFRRKPMAILGMIMLFTVVFMAVFAPLLAPYDPDERVMAQPEDILAPPDAEHLLGRDDAGKDVFSQLIYGARVSLLVGFVSSFVSMFIGTAVGLIAGYYGGKISNALMRFVDFLMVIPDLPLMLVIITLWGRGLWKIIAVISLLYWTYTARLVRSQVLTVKERTFVLRAKALGASNFRTIMIHVFPQVLPIIVAQSVLDISASIIAESTLSFLGLGDPLLVSWGMMLNFAFSRAISRMAWWFLLPPGFAIVWVSLSVIMIGTALEEIVNPRLRTHHLFDARKMLALVGTKLPPEVKDDDKDILKVRNLSIRYETEDNAKLVAVKNVSFNLKQGHSLGIVGESGCGKTTVMLALLRLLPEAGRIFDGQVLLDGQDILKYSEAEMRSVRWADLSIVFQGAMNALNPVRTVESQIVEVMKLHNIVNSSKDAQKRAGELLELVGISAKRSKQYPHQFSGGMRQRAVIAMALACNPRILIADEPTTALDVMIQAQIIELLEELQRELNLSLVLVTHDLGVVAETCDDVLVMYSGMMAEYASSDTIFNNPSHPYTQRLLKACPDIAEPGADLATIPGNPPRLDNLPPGCRFEPRCHIGNGEPICLKQLPPLIKIEPGHQAACHVVKGK